MTAVDRLSLPVTPSQPGLAAWPARAIVAAVWLFSTAGMLAYVFYFGRNVPFFDDWHMVPYITGAKPITLEWLWSQHGDHRVPLSRLLLLGIGKLCGYDFRGGMVFNVLALSLTSLALVDVSRRLRGRLSWTDSFFPLLLLNPGQWETYLWCWIVSLVLPVTLALFVLCIMATCGVRLCGTASLIAGVAVLLLPLTDPAGLAFVPAFILWLLTASFVAWRSATATSSQFVSKANQPLSPCTRGERGWGEGGESSRVLPPSPPTPLPPSTGGEGRPTRQDPEDQSNQSTTSRTAIILPLVFAAVTMALLSVYYIGYVRLQGGEGNPSLAAALRTSMEVLSMGIGHASVLAWGRSAGWSALIVPGLLVSGVYVFGRIWREQPTDRSRVVAMSFFIAGALCLVLALGWGRGGEGESAGFKSRYVVLALPVPAAIFLAWSLYRNQLQTIVQAAMCALMVVLLPLNIKTATDSAGGYTPRLDAFERDLRNGQPPSLLAEEHTNMLFPWPVYEPDRGLVHERLLMLQHAGIGPYRDMAADVPLREVELKAGSLQLDKPENVLAVRIRYAVAGVSLPQSGLKVLWKSPDHAGFEAAEVRSVPPVFGVPVANEQTVIAYINHRVDQLEIELADGHPVVIREVVLLIRDD